MTKIVYTARTQSIKVFIQYMGLNQSVLTLMLTIFIFVIFPGFLMASSVYCNVENTNSCIASTSAKRIVLRPGLHSVYPIHLKSDQTLVIGEGVVLQLSRDAELNKNAFGGISSAIISAVGTSEKPLSNVTIELDGIVDGNKTFHAYEDGGYEGINFKYVNGGGVIGKGVIQNVSGDGVDIDASTRLVLKDFTTRLNEGSGVHFGAPRPLSASRSNFVLNVISYSNGFGLNRNGFDLSWPNPWGAIFIDCEARDNNRNWDIQTNGIVIGSTSNHGKKSDKFTGNGFFEINGDKLNPIIFITPRTIELLKRDVKKLLGIESPVYLEELEY